MPHKITTENSTRATQATTPAPDEVQGMLAGMYAQIELLKMRDQVLNGKPKHSKENCTVCQQKDL